MAPVEQSQILDQILDGDTEVATKIMSNNPQLGNSLPLLLQLKGKSPGFLENLKASLRTVSPDIQAKYPKFYSYHPALKCCGM